MIINKGNYQMKVNLYHYLQGKSSFYERFFQQIKIRREYQSMNADKIKRMLDACYLAKRIRELLPELPEGVTPAYIQYMDVIHIIKRRQEDVKVSDISGYLNLPRPGVTRTVKEMEAKGYLSKYASTEDGRITYIRITEKGELLSEKYDQNYYSRLSEYMGDISEKEADCMIHTIEKFYKVMSERRVNIE